MLCRKPYKKGVLNYGCGQCTPCRINKAREWVCRMTLEAREHPYSAFVTLTYNEEHVPVDRSVHKRDVQLFLMRLRKEIYPRQIRFYAVGEYGDKTWRPHYHLIIFGLSPTEEKTVEKCWAKGFVLVGTAEPKSMGYVASYVVKKMTNPKDRRLDGRLPEFSLMSLRPGIGHGVVSRVCAAYDSEKGEAAFDKVGWITERLRLDGKQYHYGRYIKTKILDRMGIEKEIRKVHHAEVQAKVMDSEAGMDQATVDRARKTKCMAEEGRISAFRAKAKTL